MKKYKLSSIGTKILSMILLSFITALLVILIVFNLSIMGTIFIFLVWVLLGFGTYLLYIHKIIVKNDEIIIGSSIKMVRKKISDIKDIVIIDNPSINSKKFCHIKFICNNETTFQIVGYESIFHRNATKKTKEIIDRLKKDINL